MSARAADETAVANLALSHLKQPALADLNADNGTAARTLRALFGTARDAALRLCEWNFATGWARPAALMGDFLGDFAKRYPLPEDCLRVRLVSGLGPNQWAVEPAEEPSTGALVTCLATNVDAPLICYTRRIQEVRLWDPIFVEAFALVLAARAAPKLAPSESAENLEQRAQAMAAPAARVDAREKAPDTFPKVTSWLTARR